ncbi:hypothetical protein [Actinoplanes sp. NPDC051851]|uniref:TolB family protein n=1 Tax=Actinoplanes sp. NPDC051851 TaxID=3154753 RepID=UPI003428C125
MNARVSTLLHTGTTTLFEAPNWTPSDELILNGDGLLWSLPADGSADPRQIPLSGVPELNNDHVLSPDGVSIYLSANDWHLYRAPLAGGEARRITSGTSRMHFLHGVSPDDAVLAYVGIDQQDWSTASVWTVHTDGTHGTRLTAPGGVDDGPEFTPDGEWIYFNTERFSPNAQIARIRPDGTALERLTVDDRVNWFPHVAPDGSRAVYLSYPPGTRGHPADLPVELRLVDADNWRTPHTAVALPGGQGTVNVNSWSPDSASFAYVDYPFPA